MHMTHKISVNQLLMWPVRLPVNLRLLVVKFLGSEKLYLGVWLYQIHTPTPKLFTGQLYFVFKSFTTLDALYK